MVGGCRFGPDAGRLIIGLELFVGWPTWFRPISMAYELEAVRRYLQEHLKP